MFVMMGTTEPLPQNVYSKRGKYSDRTMHLNQLAIGRWPLVESSDIPNEYLIEQQNRLYVSWKTVAFSI